MTIRQNHRIIGSEKEQLAAGFLNTLGFRILERNYRIRSGEIDLIAMEGDTLCFIEVKYRSGLRYGMPAEAVDLRKQKHILLVSQHYMMTNSISYRSIRYDIVEIVGRKIRLLRNAFGETY